MFECLDEEGNSRVVRGMAKMISVRKISTMQLKKFYRKGFQLYAAHILEPTRDENPTLEEY